MNWSVREYVYQGPLEPLVDIFFPFTLLHSPEACLAIAIAGALVAAISLKRETSGGAVAVPALAPATLLLFAMYALTWGLVDEVAINLEHPYNLLHHGRFSFSPARMVDGTVEYVFYLLLTPFAWSPRALVAGTFVLGLTIAWAHLWLVAGLLRDCSRATRLSLLLLYAAYYPVVAQFSNGFGNCLVSLAFVAAVRCHFSQRATAAVVLASVLPLLRPDAILYSYALLFAMHFDLRQPWAWQSVRRWTFPMAALATYLMLHRLAYGHWIPTPVAFKSLHPAMLNGGHFYGLASVLLANMTRLPWAGGILAIIAGAFFSSSRTLFVRRLALPMALVCAFYTLGGRVIADASGDSFDRYWMGFEQTLILCILLVLAEASSRLSGADRLSQHRLVFGRLVPAMVILLVAAGMVWVGGRPAHMRNRSDLAYAGQIATRVIPANLSLATTELNTFGLAVPDREVLDLWGYTTPAIAQSRMLSASRLRNAPSWFLTLRPDVFFAYPDGIPLDRIEQFLAEFIVFSKLANMLGDMSRVLDMYEVVMLRHPQRGFILLVERGAIANLDRSLRERGFALSAQRGLDREKFLSFYDRVPLQQFKF